MTSKAFAEEMGINYRTALNWLRDGLVPGAKEEETPIGKYWKVPASALAMQRPMKPGPKKGSKRAVADTQAEESPAIEDAPAVKPVKKRAGKKAGAKK